jgi:WD40 repeat protein
VKFGLRPLLVLGLIVFSTIGPTPTSAQPALALQLGHNGYIDSIACSPDSSIIATASKDQDVKLWDAHSGEPCRFIFRHPCEVYCVVFDPSGTKLATGGADGRLRIWRIATGVLVIPPIEVQNGQIRSISWSRTGELLLTSGGSHTARISRADSGQPVLSLVAHDADITCAVFSPNSKVVAAGCSNGDVCVWDAMSGKELNSWKAHQQQVSSIAFSPDGSELVSGSIDNTAKIWEMHGYKLERTLAHPAGEGNGVGQISCVAYSPDGNTIATADFDTFVRLWSAKTGQLEQTLPRPSITSYILCTVFSPDQKSIFAASAGASILSWNTVTKKLEFNLHGYDALLCGSCSPDGKLIAAAGQDSVVRLWDANTGELVRALKGHTDGVCGLAFSPVGQILATGGVDHVVRIWDVLSGATLSSVSTGSGTVWALDVSYDGRKLACGHAGGLVTVWDITNSRHPKNSYSLNTKIGSVHAIVFSHDNSVLAFAGDDGSINLLRAATGSPIRRIENAHIVNGGAITTLAFSPDDNRLASGAWDGAVRIWNTKTGAREKSLEENGGIVGQVSFSPDGRTLASGRHNLLELWDVESGQRLHVSAGHSTFISAVRYISSGRRILTCSHDGTARIWTAHDGRLLATMVGVPEVSVSTRGNETQGTSIGTLSTVPGKGGWLVATPEGYFDCSANAAEFVSWKIGDGIYPADEYYRKFRRPDLVKRALSGAAIELPSLTAQDVPPEAHFLGFRYLGSAEQGTTSERVSVTVQVRSHSALGANAIELLVNGRPLPPEFATPHPSATAPVTGSLAIGKETHFTIQGKGFLLKAKQDSGSGIRTMTPRAGAGTDEENSDYRFMRQYEFEFPLPLGAEELRIRAVAHDSNDLGSAPIEIVLKNSLSKPVKRDLYILSVGLSHYKNGEDVPKGMSPSPSKIANLDYPAEDARDVVRRFQQETLKLYRNVKVFRDHPLVDDEATIDNIREGLQWLQGAVRPDQVDTALVFLSGHGISDLAGQYWFPAYDFDRDRLDETCLSGETLEKELGGKLRAHAVFLFLDTCHAGGVERGRPEDLRFAIRDSGVYLLASSAPSQLSFEDPNWRHGAFTEALLACLDNRSIARKGVIHFDALASSVPIAIATLLKEKGIDADSQQPLVPIESRDLNEPVCTVSN